MYVCAFNGKYNEFDFDDSEVSGLVKVNAKQTLKLLKTETGKIKATVITRENDSIVAKEQEISLEKFLVNKGETAIGKYGDVLKKVIELTTE